MNHETVLVGIIQVARKHLDWHDPVTLDMRLVEDLALDSLKLLTLAVEVENHFQICLDPEQDHELETVGDLVSAIQKRMSDG